MHIKKGFICLCVPVEERWLCAAGIKTGRLEAGGPVNPGEEVSEEREAEE